MAAKNPNSAKALFLKAMEIPETERGAFLDRECAGDDALRSEVETLLATNNEQSLLVTTTRLDGQDFARSSTMGTDMTADEADRLVGTRIGPYKLLELIGEGGFGAVYVAEQEKPVRRRVALKVIKLGMDTRQVIARFEAERQALAMMDHPNIARVLDAGATETGRPWFAMELVRGVPITEYCDSANLTAAERLALFIAVCHAVQHAHQKGVIHRDIKPSNVMVTLHDGTPVAKVIDFGIAKAVGAQLTDKTVYTLHRQMIGTPAYMAPEQAEMSGLDVDTRADVYSLGVLLYELLTGAPPFTSDELHKAGWAEMQRIIREVEPVKPSTRVNTLGETLPSVAARRRVEPRRLSLLLRGDLDWIAMKCLEKERTRRYPTANDLAADVQRHLSGEPVVAAPPSVGYRIQKFVRKHRGQVVAASLVAATLILGTIATTWQWKQAESERRIAQASLERESRERRRADDANQFLLEQNRLAREGFGKLYREARSIWDEFGETDSPMKPASMLQGLSETFQSGMKAKINIRTGEFEYKDYDIATSQGANHQALLLESIIGAGVEGIRKTGVLLKSLRFERDDAVKSRQAAELYAYASDLASVQAFMLAANPEGTRSRLQAVPEHLRGWEWNYLNALADPSILTLRNVWRAVLTPDGSRVVAVYRRWPNEEGDDIIIHDARTGHHIGARRFDVAAPMLPAISPDGRYVLMNIKREVENPRFEAVDAPSEDGSDAPAHNKGKEIAAVFDVNTGALVSRLGESITAWESTGLYPAFSHDGKRVITYSGETDGPIVWDVATGTRLAAIRNQEPLAMDSDGSRIITCGNAETSANQNTTTAAEEAEPDARGDGGSQALHSAYLWEVASGDQVLTLRGHTAKLYTAEFSDDGKRILTTSWDNTARVWDAETGRQLSVMREDTSDWDWAILSPDGASVLFDASNSSLKLLDAVSGREIRRFDTENSQAAAFSPDGVRLAVGLDDGSVQVWNALGDKQPYLIRGPLGSIGAITFSQDGRLILARDQVHPGDAVLYDASPRGDLIECAIEDWWSACATTISPDGTRLAVGLNDSTVSVRSAFTNRELVRLKGHEQGITSLAFAHDGRRIVTGSHDKTARIWDGETGRELLALRGHESLVKVAGFHPDGARVLTSSPDGTARLWDAIAGRQVAQFPCNAETLALDGANPDWKWVHVSGGETVAFSPDGSRIAVPNGRKVTSYDTAKLAALTTMETDIGQFVSILWSPDGRRMTTALYGDLAIKTWDAESGQLLWSLGEHEDVECHVHQMGSLMRLNAFAFSPDGLQLAVANVGLFDATTGDRAIPIIPSGFAMNTIGFSPDGMRLVAGCDDGMLRIWHAKTGHELAMFSGVDGTGDDWGFGVISAAFSPDGTRIVTTAGGTARLWDGVPWRERLRQLQQSSR